MYSSPKQECTVNAQEFSRQFQRSRGQDRHLKTQRYEATSHITSHVILTTVLQGRYSHPKFTTEESEAQVYANCPRSWVSTGFSPSLSNYQAQSHSHSCICFTPCQGADSPRIRAHWRPPEGSLLPSLSLPSSAADPFGKMVLTKIPICPRMQSRPPAMLKPRPWMQRRWGCRLSVHVFTEGTPQCSI